MEIYNEKQYYSVEEVAKIFNVKNISSILIKIKFKNKYIGKWIKVNDLYFIDKNFIDKILSNRELSLTVKQTATAIGKSLDATREMLKTNRLNYFKDKWDSKFRVYKKDINELISLGEDYYTVEQLGSILGVTANNIRKKIKFNYCNINSFVKRPHKNKILINKNFMEQLGKIEANTCFLEYFAKEIDLKQIEILKICQRINEEVLVNDFMTGKWRIKKDCLDFIKNKCFSNKIKIYENYTNFKFLLREVLMTQDQINTFALEHCNINISDKVKSLNDRLFINKDVAQLLKNKVREIYDSNNELLLNNIDSDRILSVYEIYDIFGVSEVTLSRKIRKNYCNVKEYIIPNKKILIKITFLDHLRSLVYNSIVINTLSKEKNIQVDKLLAICEKISDKSFFKDFFTRYTRVKKEYLSLIEKEIGYIKTKNKKLSKSTKIKKKSEYTKSKMKDLIRLTKLSKEFFMTENKLIKFIGEKIDIEILYNIQVINNKKFIHKNFEENLKQQINSYYEKVELTSIKLSDYLKEKSLSRKKLEDILKRENNIDLDNHIILIKNNRFINNEFAVKVSSNIEKYYEKNYLLISILADEFLIEKRKLSKFLKKIGVKFTKYNNQELIEKNLIKDVILKIKEFVNKEQQLCNSKNKSLNKKDIDISERKISISELAKQFGINSNRIIKICRYENITLERSPLNKFIISKENISRIKESQKFKETIKFKRSLNASKRAQNEFQVYDYIKEEISVKKEIINTSKLFTEFSYKKISKTNGRESRRYEVARLCGNLLEFLNDTLIKEIYYYNDDDILKLFSKINTTVFYKPFRSFLEYCKESTECKYVGYYTYNEGKNPKINTKEEIYTNEEWNSITKHLTDVDAHITKAFDDQSYSCLWFLSILHLVSTWRLNDFVTKIPNIDLDVLGIYDFQWFKIGNEFTLSMGQSVLNQLKVKLSGVTADKNNEQLRVFCNLDFVIPVTIAYIIAEIHRRKNNHLKIFSIFLNEKYNNSEIYPTIRNKLKLFLKDKGIKAFNNLKANRTLLTYLYEYANTMEGMHSISYILCGSMRSHKNNRDMKLPLSTQIYLKPILHNEEVNSISYNLLKRGFFGWLPYKLLQIAYSEDNFKKLDINSITVDIIKLRQDFTLMGLENFANYLNNDLYEKRQLTVLNELIKLDKHTLKEHVKNILTYESCAKLNYCGCLKGRICAYPHRKSCTSCEYLVKNLHFLSYLDEEINEVLDKLHYIDIEKENERIKYSKILFNLLSIITEAKGFYANFDYNLVDSFIDVKKLNEKIKLIQHKLLILK